MSSVRYWVVLGATAYWVLSVECWVLGVLGATVYWVWKYWVLVFECWVLSVFGVTVYWVLSNGC